MIILECLARSKKEHATNVRFPVTTEERQASANERPAMRDVCIVISVFILVNPGFLTKQTIF